MKKIGALFFAAILGSLCTLGFSRWLSNDHVQLQYIPATPVNHVSYKGTGTNAAAPSLDFTTVAAKVVPAVVHVRSTYEQSPQEQEQQYFFFDPFKDFFGPNQKPQPMQASGSGVIISDDGYIVTNNHVVKDADIVEVILSDNRSYKAEVIGTDPDTDIALIKINEKNLPTIPFVDSDQTQIGQWVLAVGNPYNLNSTVTAGIVSAKDRNINIINSNESEGEPGQQPSSNTAIEAFIQTDAAINPGNSGGALVDLSGGLVGINTAIASPTGSYSGYGFAVPSNLVRKIVEDLMKYGTVQRGWLGVSIQNVNSELAKQENLSVTEGAYVGGFADNSAAKDAGIEKGDVVTRIDGNDIHSSAALIEYIGSHRPGDKINVTVNRAGKELTFPVTLKGQSGTTTITKVEDRSGYAALGIQLQDVDAKTLKGLDLSSGVKVTSLGNGKIARLTDMREGFIITKLNDEPVKSVKDFNDKMKQIKEGDLVILSGIYEDFPREFNYAFRM